MSHVTEIKDLKTFDGQEVRVQGWMYGKRSGGKILFLLLRDGTGICQCIVEAALGDDFSAAKALHQESALRLTGKVSVDDRAPGGCELHITAIEVVSEAAEDYPISRKAHGIDFLMTNRHLWLRSDRQASILRIRHTIISAAREYFDTNGFTLIDTPILAPGAAEGAGTLFPVDYFGEEVYLAQTGQLYLEAACKALGKVYCFGPTFRAEKSKTRRHLTEFWMIEPEIAFADLNEVIGHAEAFVCHIVSRVLERHRSDLIALGRDIDALEKITPPFPRLTYTEAVDLLHSDKIQQWLEQDIESSHRKLGTLSEKLTELEAQRADAKKQWQQEKLDKEIHELGDEVRELRLDTEHRVAHKEDAKAFTWGGDLGGDEETILSKQYDKPLFITEYPKKAKAFYMKESPENKDVVLNVDMLAPEGYGEVIGGSQREDDLDRLLERMKEEDMDTAPYEWYLDLRRYGSVPHGGFGLGIERTVSWICGLKHVRETIPFPRLMGRIYP